MSEIIDIFRKRGLSPEQRANLIQLKADLEIKRWELSQEIEAIQKRVEDIEEELG